MENFYYFDNGATSYPKPKEVIDAWVEYATEIGASPGRGNYGLSIDGGKKITETRQSIAELIGARNPKRLVFAKNATEAMNVAIFGLLQQGDHVITTVTEHNAVRRPLNKVKDQRGVDVSVAKADQDGLIHADAIFSLVKPCTKYIVVNGISNVTGIRAPIREIGEYCVDHDITFIVDGAQLLGSAPVDINMDAIDILVFTGHKNLLGPTGTGGMYFPMDKEPCPLLWGSTGGFSEMACMPDELPYKYEAGTSNAAGLYALGAGVKYVMNRGVENILAHKLELADYFLEKVNSIDKNKVLGVTNKPGMRVGVVSFHVPGMDTKALALQLWEKYRIAVRGGLHCAPDIHEFFGVEGGSLRFSFGLFNTKDQIDYAEKALKELLK